LVPLTCEGSPDRVRWVTPPLVLSFTGPVARVPAPLARLLTDGTLAEVVVEPSSVVTRLAPGHGWDVDGARVRTALHAALADPSGWAPAPGVRAPGDDAVLFAIAREVIDTIVAPYARSHGGDIRLVAAAGGVVTVRLGGACHGCPAARLTMRHRLERELRRRYPSLRGVSA
jgi:Fe-S cluster biogenesis protein NfuA